METPLQQAFSTEVESTLLALGITIEDDDITRDIVDVLVNNSDDMWDVIEARIREVAKEVIGSVLVEEKYTPPVEE